MPRENTANPRSSSITIFIISYTLNMLLKKKIPPNIKTLFGSKDFFSPRHIKKNLTILKYQTKSIYNFFWQLSANSRDESNEPN